MDEDENENEEEIEKMKERAKLAMDKTCSSWFLDIMSKDKRPIIRAFVASNVDNITPEILERLSRDENVNVRVHVALNQKSPPDILRRLSDDKDELVRIAVAINPFTPVDIRDKLKNDESFTVRLYAIGSNPDAYGYKKRIFYI